MLLQVFTLEATGDLEHEHLYYIRNAKSDGKTNCLRAVVAAGNAPYLQFGHTCSAGFGEKNDDYKFELLRPPRGQGFILRAALLEGSPCAYADDNAHVGASLMFREYACTAPDFLVLTPILWEKGGNPPIKPIVRWLGEGTARRVRRASDPLSSRRESMEAHPVRAFPSSQALLACCEGVLERAIGLNSLLISVSVNTEGVQRDVGYAIARCSEALHEMYFWGLQRRSGMLENWRRGQPGVGQGPG